MGVNTPSGWRLYIGSEDADDSVDTQNEFESESWTEVGEIEDMGEFGDAWNSQTFSSLSDSRVRRFKTVKDAGEMSLVIGMDSDDAGQAALVTATDSLYNHTFKITANDAGSGSPSSPTTYYFRAMVMSNRRAVGALDNIVRRNVTLAINSAILEVAAV